MAKPINKITVKSKDNDGKSVTIIVKRPTGEHTREAKAHYNQTFRTALETGALLRKRLGQYMEEQGIWDDAKEKQYQDVTTRIIQGEKKLKTGGIKLTEARELAFSIKTARDEFRELIGERTMMDANTAEGQADNAQFNCLVALCTFDEAGEQVFKDLDDYEKRSDEPFAAEAAGKLAEFVYNLNEDYDSTLEENKFLKKFNFVNDDYDLINKDGDLVDTKGNLINKEGRFVDKDGNLIDKDGVPVDEEGNFLIDTQPFLDDDGNPIILEEEKPKKKTTRKKAETTTS
tara:strand:+ start:17513 stop:18376 length:864 start_codon:yes stop_codon:yes gene_type:complete